MPPSCLRSIQPSDKKHISRNNSENYYLTNAHIELNIKPYKKLYHGNQVAFKRVFFSSEVLKQCTEDPIYLTHSNHVKLGIL